MTDTFPRWRTRLYEMIPGVSVWSALVLAGVLSFLTPTGAIIFIIVFDLFWCFRVFSFVFFLLIAWRTFRKTMRTDWDAAARALPATADLLHVIFLPTYTEGISVIRETLQTLAKTLGDHQRMWIVLAGEEREAEKFFATAHVLQEEWKNIFGNFLVTLHPAHLPGEIPGKGSNLAWAGKQVQAALDEQSISYERVIVSAFDVDTLVHPHYFQYLSWLYATTPDPTRASYQPIALYANNIWESPAAVRVAAFGTTFWIMTELARRDLTVTFSSHSMSMQALVDVGFWETNVVSEDSRIFLQCLRHYHGNYRVVSMFLPVSMDTVGVGGYTTSLVRLYKQVRRWAWGVEHFPYICRYMVTDKKTPLHIRLRLLWNEWEGRFSWATSPLIMFFMGRLPLWVATSRGLDSVLVSQAPFVLEWLMRFAMVGVCTSAFFSYFLMPQRPQHTSRWTVLVIGLQWLLVPVTFILFGSIPALDAQTRLMLGKYLGFNVSAKRST